MHDSRIHKSLNGLLSLRNWLCLQSIDGKMEADERPNKKPRLSNDGGPESPEIKELVSTTAIDSEQPGGEHKNASRAEEGNAGRILNGHADKQHSAPKAGSPTNNGEDGIALPDDIAPTADAINGDPPEPTMSKNQQKKLRKKLEWESKRDERKVIRKQKLVAKRERKRAARDQALETGELQNRPPSQLSRPQKAVLLPITILIDCDFDDLMRDPERKSLAGQITRSYSDNRKALFRSYLAVCSFGGQLRERFDNVLTHYKGWRGVKFLDCDFVEAADQAKQWMADSQQGGTMAGVFSKFDSSTEDSEMRSKLQDEAETVYLTSESDYTLTELKPYSTYIIGGLVDKNREKGICYKRATQRGVKTARLPIGEFMDMRSRKVLATNHVNEIMIRWLECGDWGEAFMKVIPKRKGGRLKGTASEADADGNLDDEDEEGDEGGGEGDLEVESNHSEARNELEAPQSDNAEEHDDTTAGLEA